MVLFAKNQAPIVLDDKLKGEYINCDGKRYKAESMEFDKGMYGNRIFVWFARKSFLLLPDRFKIDLNDLLFDEKNKVYKSTPSLTIKGEISVELGHSRTTEVKNHTAQDFVDDKYKPLKWYLAPQKRLEDYNASVGS